MNGSYDFSAMSGEVTYADATLKYKFDIAEWTTTEMEGKKNEIEDWFWNVIDAEITDDYSTGYFYKGNAKGIEWQEDFGQGHITLTFSVYPYKYAKKMCIRDSACILRNGRELAGRCPVELHGVLPRTKETINE